MLEPEPVDHQPEPLAILGQLDRFGAGADDRYARSLERSGQIERRLPAELNDHPHRLDAVADVEHVFHSQRLEKQSVRSVIIGADRFGVGVDHHHFIAALAQGKSRLAAAIVKFDALADAVGTAAQDHDARPIADASLVFAIHKSNNNKE